MSNRDEKRRAADALVEDTGAAVGEQLGMRTEFRFERTSGLGLHLFSLARAEAERVGQDPGKTSADAGILHCAGSYAVNELPVFRKIELSLDCDEEPVLDI